MLAKPARVVASILALGALSAGGPVRAFEESLEAAGPEVIHMQIEFKLDPRITKAVYMGERWVSPPTYVRTSQDETVVVDARVMCRDSSGRPLSAPPTWHASDPDMITVSQAESPREAAITVQRTGDSVVEVDCGGTTRQLRVAARPRGEGLYVEIAQDAGGARGPG